MIGFEPLPYPNLDAFLMAPVTAGLWQQHETFDGTYDLDDLLDAHELLDTNAINKMRAQEAARSEVNK